LEEIENLIKKLKNQKAPEDNINSELFKLAGENIAKEMQPLIN
jgi:hypothetical protein